MRKGMRLIKVEKVVVSMGGEGYDYLHRISGQKPVHTRSSKNMVIGGKRISKGQVVGVKVTLRRGMRDNYLKYLVNVILPRLKNFKGFEERSGVEVSGLSIGIGEQVYPEMEEAVENCGMNIMIVVKGSKKREETVEALKEVGIPFYSNN